MRFWSVWPTNCLVNFSIYLVPSMWFWSVSWSTNCPVYFSFFLVDQRKICPVSDLFCSISWIFCQVFFENVVLVSLLADQLSGQFLIFWKRLDKKFKRVNKKDLRLDKFFFGWPKKVREIDWTIGRPRDWPKPLGQDYNGWFVEKKLAKMVVPSSFR